MPWRQTKGEIDQKTNQQTGGDFNEKLFWRLSQESGVESEIESE